MSKYIIKFSRGEQVKYISHLDFVRMFHRSVRRAGLDFVFSQGFNPHPIMTVAVPLSVGVTADGEYMKVGFETDLSETALADTLNASLPNGFEVKAIARADDNLFDFKSIERAEYYIDAECGNADAFSADELMSNSALAVMKKSKSGEKETDIKPYIHAISKVPAESGSLGISAILSAGNTATLKPETLISAINKYLPSVNIGFFSARRKALLTADNKELL